MDFLACGEERKPWPAGTTLGDIVTSESYLRIWTFIATHGERHHCIEHRKEKAKCV